MSGGAGTEWAHDLGGRPGFGPVVMEADEPVFHEPWERTARALVYVAAGLLPHPSTSGFRHSIERMEPEHYLTSSYYEHWFTAAATMAVESGRLTKDELEAAAGGPVPLARAARPVEVTPGSATRFAVGDRVRVRVFEPAGHTRAPAYVRGRVGTVTARSGAFPLPDLEAHSPRRDAEQTYEVRFSADELWGDEDAVHVTVGLWDSYLEPA